MTRSWNIVMTRILENCDESRHGALCYQVSWSIVMTGFMKHCAKGVMEHCDDKVMEHCDDKNSGAL